MNKWQAIESCPPNKWVLMYEDGDVFKGRIQAWVDGPAGSEDCSYASACGQPVCYPPEPTHWQLLPDEPER